MRVLIMVFVILFMFPVLAFAGAEGCGFTNAVSAHAIARAAHRSGIRPMPAVVDRLAEAKL